MKEVKRYTVNGYMYLHTPIGNFIPTDNVDNNLFVTASDFDSIVKELEGKLKVAVDKLENIAAMGNGPSFTANHPKYEPHMVAEMCITEARKALAQIEDK